MASFSIRLDGQPAFAVALDVWLLGKTREVAAVIERHARIVRREAQGLAPVDTGHLRSEIRADLSELAARLVAYVVSGATYGGFVEWGTRFMAAQPYLFPAAEADRADFFRDIRGVFAR